MLDEHEEKLIQTEQNLRRKIWILRQSLVNTKSRFIIYRAIIRSKFLYAATTICTYNHRFTLKLEAMLYRILKNLFYIRTNVKKEKVFKVLGIWNIEEAIRRANLRKCGLQIEEDSNRLIEYLSLKVIKLRMGWLFSRNPKLKKCSCQCQITNEHIILDWPKTMEWRSHWNKISLQHNSQSILHNLLELRNWTEIESTSKLLNDSTESLLREYITV